MYPLTTLGNGWDSLVEKGGLSQAYALQGRHELAGAVTAEQATNFGISLLPGERLLALGKVGGATNALDGLVWHDASRSAKGTGAVVDDTIKALPAPRQIDASWSASTYKKGGLMTGIEHVFYRHGPDSGFANVSKFSQGTSVKDVSSYVDNALRYGKVTPNGPGGHVIEYNAGKVVGTNVSGAPRSTIKINVRDGVIQTAFPH